MDTLREVEGVPRPEKSRVLTISRLGKVSVTRPNERTLRMHPEAGLFDAEIHQMHYSPTRTCRKGQTVELSDMAVTVLETTADGRPLEVEFRFKSPLESPERIWMRGSGLGLVPWTLPAVGETVVLSE